MTPPVADYEVECADADATVALPGSGFFVRYPPDGGGWLVNVYSIELEGWAEWFERWDIEATGGLIRIGADGETPMWVRTDIGVWSAEYVDGRLWALGWDEDVAYLWQLSPTTGADSLVIVDSIPTGVGAGRALSLEKAALADGATLWIREHRRFEVVEPGRCGDEGCRLFDWGFPRRRPDGGYLIYGVHAYPSSVCSSQPVVIARVRRRLLRGVRRVLERRRDRADRRLDPQVHARLKPRVGSNGPARPGPAGGWGDRRVPKHK